MGTFQSLVRTQLPHWRYFLHRFLVLMAFLCLLSVQNTSLNAQKYPYEKYTIWDGLPQIQVMCIEVDANGAIWAGTKDGLCRFDGLSFQVFGPAENFFGNSIKKIEKSLDGNIWILHDRGISAFRKGKFENYEIDDLELSRIVFDDQDYPLLLTKKFTNIYRLKNTAPYYELVLDTLPVEFEGHNATYIETEDELYITSQKLKEVFAVNCKTGKWRALFSITDLTGKDKNFYSLLHTKRGATFISTDLGIYQVVNDSLEIFSAYEKEMANAMYELKDDGILLSQSRRSLFEATENNIRPYPYLNRSKLNDALIDEYGNLWMGTENGLIKMLGGAFTHLEEGTGGGEYVWSMVNLDETGKVLLASYGAGLFEYDPKENRSRNLTKEIAGIREQKNYYYGASKTSDGRIFLPNDKGYVEYQYGKYRHFDVAGGTLASYFDVEKELLFLGNENGFMTVDAEGNRKYYGSSVKWLSEVENWDPGSYVVDIEKDKEGFYWLGSWRKLSRFNLETGEIKVFEEGQGSIDFRGAVSIFRDSRQNMWFGTTNGLYSYDYSKAAVIKHDMGEREGTVSSLMESSNKLFLGMQKGLVVFDLEKYYDSGRIAFDFYDKSHGFSGIESQQNSIIKDDEDRVWISTTDKVTIIEPSLLKRDTIAPKLHFHSITFGDSLINLVDSVSLEGKVFRDYSGAVTINFRGQAAHNPSGTLFSYRMKELDSFFSEAQLTSSVSYSELSPGEYTFELLAINPTSGSRSEIKTLHFEVQTKWQQSTSLKALVGIMLAVWTGALVFWYRDRRALRYARQRREKLELQAKAQANRTRALFAQMNPHFVNNALTAIHSFVLSNSRDQADKYLVKFADLMRLVLKESSQDYISLKEEVELITKYVELEHLRFADKFDYKIDFQGELTEGITIPAMMIQPLVENAINHGLKYRKEKGFLNILFKNDQDHISCVVDDNGVGRARAKRIKDKSQSRYKSISTGILDERIDIMRQEGKEVSMEITDKNTMNSGETGTRVKISFNI